ncbi:MAG: hypothetical protein DRQ43_04405 [Gammaproteobacteria bacterium]|nr:MAG: hypothetical protein DRQ43_04405 [Gammaproteobacteria bacterium]
MEKRILFLILPLLTPVVVHAADISGFVRNAGNQPMAGAEVQYFCNGKPDPYSATTNSYGRYRVRGLPNVTWCSVKVNGGQTSPAMKINSGSGSKEVNLRI